MKVTRTIFSLFIAQILFFFASQAIFCQEEKLDFVTYTPPKGWVKTPKADLVLFSDVNKTTNTFCLLTVNSGTPSVGTAKDDFAAQWKKLVVQPHKGAENPSTETEIRDRWTVSSASTPIDSDGIKAFAVLVVFSGFGKTASVLTILNSDTYLPQLGEFLKSIKLDKTAVAATSSAPSSQPVANSYDPASLVGKWGSGIAGDTVSGNYVSYGSVASQKYYQFNADGTYRYVYSGYSGLAGRSGTFQITTQESGVYAINGDSMTITPKKSQTKTNSDGLRDNPLEVVTYRWTIHYFEGIKEFALILHPDHQTKRDGGFDYVMAFPQSYSYSKGK